MPVRMLGRKLGMSQIYSESGESIPVTVISAGPATVVQLKTTERDGYDAVQLGFEPRKANFRSKPLAGHFRQANIKPTRNLKESRLDAQERERYAVGQQVTAGELFQKGDRVDVIGTSKGRGFTGVVKRHGFAGKPATHGTHEYKRHGGSIGMHTKPGRVFKGMRMAGQHGNTRVTVQNLEVIEVDAEKNLVLVRGAIPGATGGLVLVQPAVKGSRAA